MLTDTTCCDCSAELTREAQGGLCVQCLFRLGLSVGADERARRHDAVVTEQPGDQIGRYKLLQKLGEGGCGVVYLAEQEKPLRRRVALKVIKLGMDTREIIARFEAERQALAMMDHPYIAKVLDAGATDTGRPYFVMELAQGVRITGYGDEHRLPLRERLELFIKVCQAIQHAHQKGIIHRDIKPSNILVTVKDGGPVPEVIDFGIAKATEGRLTDKTLFTAFHQLMGTPAYMSPEQVAMTSLDIDTRSDIYSLGVLLYELLTGTTPFESKALLADGLDAMVRTIREQEPMRPSLRVGSLPAAQREEIARRRQTDPARLAHQLRGDLDWIVMKALEKDRSRRYESANILALDIQRFLAFEPVTAAAPSVAYRFGKFARRHRTALGLTASIAATLVFATVASLVQSFRATRAEALARHHLLQAVEERNDKEKARQEAEAISSFLIEVFRSPDASRDGRTITVAETLDRAVERLDADLSQQTLRRAELQRALGMTYAALGLGKEAIPLFEQAQHGYVAALGAEHTQTLTTMARLANCLYDVGRREEALQLREQLLPVFRKVNGPKTQATLGLMHNLATSYQDAGRLEAALQLREQVLTLRIEVLGPEHSHTLLSMNNLAQSYDAAGRQKQALRLREQVRSILLRSKGPEHPNTLLAIHNLAISYHATGRAEEALQMREHVLALRRKVLEPEHPHTLQSMSSLAVSYHAADRHQEAFQLQEDVLALHVQVHGPDHPDTLKAMHQLALAFAEERIFARAEPRFRKILQVQAARFPSTNDTVVVAASALAGLLIEWAWNDRHAADKSQATERAREAERLVRDCLSTPAPNPKQATLPRPILQRQLGDALVAIAASDSTLTGEARQAHWSAAESLLLEAHESVRQPGHPMQPDEVQKSLHSLVRLYEASGNNARAVEWRTNLQQLGQANSARHAAGALNEE